MKYKTLKMVSCAVKTKIVLLDENRDIEEIAIIDYLANDDHELYDKCRVYGTHAFVPDYVLNAEIELVNGDSATGGLYIIAHKAQ